MRAIDPASSFGLRALLWLLGGLPFRLLLILCVCIGAIVSTENGLRAVLAVLKQVLPTLHIGAFKGTLIGPLQVDQFSYQRNGFSLTFAHADLDWQWQDILQGRLHLRRLHAQSLHVQLPESSPRSESTQPVVIRLPFPMAISDLQVRDLRIQPAHGNPITINAIDLSAFANTGALGLQGTVSYEPMTLRIAGALQFADQYANITGQWAKGAWPFTGAAQVESPQGEISFKGTAQTYQFHVAADMRGPDIPHGHWIIDGNGSNQAIQAATVQLHTLGGTINGVGNVAWSPTVRWQADVTGTALNLALLRPDVIGQLNLHLKNEGTFDSTGLKTRVLLEDLTGTIHGQPVRGRADVALQGAQLTVTALHCEAGDAHLEASGTVAQQWEMRWKLDTPKLQSLLPTLSGALTSSGTLSGPRPAPTVVANLLLRDVQHQDIRIQQLRSEGRIDLSGAARSEWRSVGEGLSIAGQRWKTMTITAAGTPDAHAVTAEGTSDIAHFQVGLKGQLQRPAFSWQGQITQLSAQEKTFGAWQLEKPIAVNATQRIARIDTACLKSAPTRVCVQGHWGESAGWNVQTQLFQLMPERFAAFLPREMQLATSISGDLRAEGKSSGAVQGTLNLSLAPGRITLQANKQPVRLTLNGGTVQGNFTDRMVNAQATLDLAQTGTARATVQAQAPFNNARITGTLNATVTDLSTISLFAPQLQHVSGHIKTDIAFSGTPAKLLLRGEARVENARAALPESGITIENLQLTATSTGQGPVQLTGSLRSGQGTLQWSGKMDPLQSRLNLRIQGRDVQALNTTDTQLQISPDLLLDIADHQVRLTGDLTIPKAALRPSGTPGVVKPSSDVIIVQNTARDATTTPSTPKGLDLFAKVRVMLGDAVSVETPAFTGKLAGTLVVEETPQLAPRGSGSIQVVAGNYRIYGEAVQIERGQLLFSSSPLDNPGLDLRVTRHSQGSGTTGNNQITAGANIQGTLKHPKLTLFSDPKMPDSNVLSYLVLGRSSTGAESALLYKAANAMGLGGSSLTRDVSDKLGLDALELNSGNGDQKATSLMLGKYLTPDLYVGYGVGLFNAVNTFTVKYRLNQRLSFESNSNAAGVGADMTYTIEQ